MPLFKNRFEKMFEGYERQTFFDVNGKRVTKMVYTGTRFEQQLDDRQRIIYKIAYLVLLIAGMGLIVASGIPRVPGNFLLYVTIPEALCILLGVLSAIYIFTYLGAPKAMDTYTYQRANERLKILVFLSGCASVITAICSVISIFISQAAGNGIAWLCAGLQLLSSVCYFVIWFLERRTVYTISD